MYQHFVITLIAQRHENTATPPIRVQVQQRPENVWPWQLRQRWKARSTERHNTMDDMLYDRGP